MAGLLYGFLASGASWAADAWETSTAKLTKATPSIGTVSSNNANDKTSVSNDSITGAATPDITGRVVGSDTFPHESAHTHSQDSNIDDPGNGRNAPASSGRAEGSSTGLPTAGTKPKRKHPNQAQRKANAKRIIHERLKSWTLEQVREVLTSEDKLLAQCAKDFLNGHEVASQSKDNGEHKAG